MPLGPIELVAIGFPEKPSGGRIAEEIQSLVDREVVTLVDALFISKEEDGSTSFLEVEQVDTEASIKKLAEFLDDPDGLLGDEDVDAIADALEPGESALILVFENTWVRGVRDAIRAAGGELMAQIRVPGPVVEEVLAAVADE